MDFGLSLVGLPAPELLDTARQAEDWGYRALYLPDHWALENPGGGGLDDSTPTWESVAMLGAIAAVTTKARLGALVMCNLFRHPGSTAQAITTLDHISGGRAMLGLGAGWTRAEFEMMGAPFPDVKPRLRMLEESMRAIRELWTKDRASFDGEFYRLTDAMSTPKPVQQPHPPILVGGGGKGLLRIAARLADKVNIGVDTGRAGTVDRAEVARTTDAALATKASFLRSELEKAGRNPASVELSSTVFTAMIADTAEQADAFAEGLGQLFGLDADDVKRMPVCLIGTVEQCAEEMARREKAWGLTHYVISGRASPGIAERFMREVVPAM